MTRTARIHVDMDITVCEVASDSVGSSPAISLHFHMHDGLYVSAASTVTNDLYTALMDGIQQLNIDQPNTVNRVRIDLGWSTFMSNSNIAPNDSYYYVRRIANLCADFLDRGITPWLVVHRSPRWSRPSQTGSVLANNSQLPDDATSVWVFATWLAIKCTEWGVSEVQFWNEPNLTSFAGIGRNTAARYVPVLKSFYDAAKSANPDLKIGAPGTSQNDWKWLEDCYSLGLRDCCDFIVVHPYQGRQSVNPKSMDVSKLSRVAAGWEKARVATGLPRVYSTMVAYGDVDKVIWAGEVGFADDNVSDGSGGYLGVGDVGVPDVWPTRADKAAFYHAEFLDMLTTGLDDSGVVKPVYSKVKLVNVYDTMELIEDGSPSPIDPHQVGFDLFTVSGSTAVAKPQAMALKTFRANHPTVRSTEIQ